QSFSRRRGHRRPRREVVAGDDEVIAHRVPSDHSEHAVAAKVSEEEEWIPLVAIDDFGAHEVRAQHRGDVASDVANGLRALVNVKHEGALSASAKARVAAVP